jgi:hypothetical protein
MATGKSSRRAALRLACVLLAAATAGGAAGDVVKGQSRELGIRFEIRGGEAWCGAEVAVDLTAATANAVKPDAPPFVRMAGRIRAVVMDQCPAVERILFHAAAPRGPIATLETTRLTRWRGLAHVDSATRRPICPLQGPAAAECGKRADAYLAVHRIMRGEQFAEAELTTVLDDKDEAHAVWVVGGVVGKLTVQDRGDLGGRFASNGQLGDAIGAAVVAQCRRDGGAAQPAWAETWFGGSEREMAVRGLSCRPQAGRDGHHVLLVMQVATRFHIFAFLADQGDAAAARTAARRLALGFFAAP